MNKKKNNNDNDNIAVSTGVDNNLNIDDEVAQDDFGTSIAQNDDNLEALYRAEGEAGLRGVDREVYKSYPLRCIISIKGIKNDRARLMLYIVTRAPAHSTKWLNSQPTSRLVQMAGYYQAMYNAALGRNDSTSDEVRLYNFYRVFRKLDKENLAAIERGIMAGENENLSFLFNNNSRNNSNNNDNNNNDDNNMNINGELGDNEHKQGDPTQQVELQLAVDELGAAVAAYNNGGPREQFSRVVAKWMSKGGQPAELAKEMCYKHLAGDQPPRKKARFGDIRNNRNVRK